MSAPTESRIRPARPAEAGVLTALALRSKAHWGYSSAFMAACRDELRIKTEDIASGPVAYFVLETGSGRSFRLAGFYGLAPVASRRYELDALFIEPAYIGAGFGCRLVRHALETARAAGGRTLLVQGDPHAEGFYRAVGGKPAGRSESLSIPGRSLPVFEIDVPPASSMAVGAPAANCVVPEDG